MLSSSQTSARSSDSRSSIVRCVVIVVVGAVLIVGATWVPKVSFWWQFQNVILAQGEDPDARAVLWNVPEDRGEVAESTWDLIEEKAGSTRVPPGPILEIESLDTALRVRMKAGEVLVKTFRPGLVGLLMRKELGLFGAEEMELPGDAELLAEVFRETPENYEFDWPGARRAEYAARLLTRMLLLDRKPTKQLGIARRGTDNAVLAVEFQGGGARLLVVDRLGMQVVDVPHDAPPEWTESLGNWIR